jgi:anti-anti-sigma factor
MIDYKVKEDGNNRILTMSGDLTIQSAATLQTILLDSLKDTNSLVINIENITAVDMSCLQLFCSAYRTAEASDKSFAIDSTCAETFREAARDAGYAGQSGCGQECECNCLMVEDTHNGQ